MKVEKHILGMVGTNCYVVYDEETKEALIIDPADNSEFLEGRINANGLKLRAVLLTHGHFDHIMAVNDLASVYRMPVYACEVEAEVLKSPRYNLCETFGLPSAEVEADHLVKDGDILEIAGFSIRVLFTPGHTKGGCCYYFEDEKAVFTGDTLFYGSVGRTDFPTGDMSVLIRSIQEKLMALPDDVMVYPGHESRTTIGQERAGNPYIKGGISE